MKRLSSLLGRRPSRDGARALRHAAFVLAGVLCMAPSAPAQVEPRAGFFPPVSQEYQVLWQRMERLEAEGDWAGLSGALRVFADLFDRPEVNLTVSNGAGGALGLRKLFARYVNRLPPEAFEEWRTLLDTLVERRWAETAGNLFGAERAAMRHRLLRDYPQSRFWLEAAREELDVRALEGDWPGVLRIAERLSEVLGDHATRRERIQLETLRVLALARLARPAEHAAARARLRAALEEPAEGEIPEELAAYARRVLEVEPAAASPTRSGFAAGLSVARTGGDAVPGVPFRLGPAVWERAALSPALARTLSERRLAKDGTRRRDGQPEVPYHAAVSGDLLVFQHDGLLLGYHLGFEREIWSTALPGDGPAFAAVRAPLLLGDLVIANTRTGLIAFEASGGTQRWRLSFRYDKDSKRIREVRSSGVGNLPPQPRAGDEPVPLLEVSPCTPSATGRSFYAGVSVRVGKETLSYLVSAGRTGTVLWSAYLGSARTPAPLAMAPSGSPPFERDGTVFYLSNTGFIAAADAEDGTILWIEEYPVFAPRGLEETRRSDRRWHTNPLVPLDDGAIAAAPQDSPYLFGFRPADGGIEWRVLREESSSIAGVAGGTLYVAGRTVKAVSTRGEERGRILWSVDLSSLGFEPAGRGTLRGKFLHLPGRDTLLCLDAERGTVVARELWDAAGSGGNLLFAKDKLAVVHPGGLRIHAAKPATPPPAAGEEELLLRARMHLRAGEAQAALETLKRWAEIRPSPPSANSRLDQLRLAVADLLDRLARVAGGSGGAPGAGNGAEASRSRAVALELLRYRLRVESAPTRKVEAAIRLAEAYHRRGQRVEAVETLYEALAYDALKPGGTQFTVEGFCTVPSSAYIRDRILEWRSESPQAAAEFARVEEKARKALEECRTKATPVAYEEFLRLFPYTEAAAAGALELARSYLDRKEPLLAARVLVTRLRDFPNRSDNTKVALQAADLLYRAGKRHEAKRLYERILEERPNDLVEGVEGVAPGETASEYARRRLKDPGLAGIQTERRSFRFPARMAWRSPAVLLDSGRAFLLAKGQPPEAMRGTFLTQSRSAIECRSVETGIPLWTVYLALIPGYVEDPYPFGLRFVPSGSRAWEGTYSGDLLVLYNRRNILAVDAARGREAAGEAGAAGSLVRWHVPFGVESGEPGGNRLHRLGERLRGVAVDSAGVTAVAAATDRRRLIRYNLAGEVLWEVPLSFDPAPQAPIVRGGEVFVLRQRPERRGGREDVILHAYRLADGRESTPFTRPVRPGLFRLVDDPIALPGGDTLLVLPRSVERVDLTRRDQVWAYAPPSGTVEAVLYSEDRPNEVLLGLQRANNWPAVVSLDLASGREIWRYEKFPAAPTTLTLYRDGDHVFVIHGQQRWKLLALEVRRRGEPGHMDALPLWPEEVSLGTYFASPSKRRLHITEDAVIFADPHRTLKVFDRRTGAPLGAQPQAIARFLVEKDSFTSEIFDGRLVLLTDGGDCAFETTPPPEVEDDPHAWMGLVRACLRNPADAAAVADLALAYFRRGEITAALDVLDRALTSEAILSQAGERGRQVLGYLLDGIKEEAMKAVGPPTIAAPRLDPPPSIDGELEDAWSIAHRVRIAMPRHINLIQAPGHRRDWEGEEDLSAVLYTGWDDRYFYFALDVEDDVLRAYDRDAEFWKGDCLIIGLDPEGDGGYRQHPNDQLMTLALTIPKRNKVKKDRDGDGRPDGEEGEEGEDEDEALKPEGLFSVKKKDDDSGTVYEVALPWSSFRDLYKDGLAPPIGYRFGLSLVLTDDDTGNGATRTLSLNPAHLLPREQKHFSVYRLLIPEFFPKVVLTGPGEFTPGESSAPPGREGGR